MRLLILIALGCSGADPKDPTACESEYPPPTTLDEVHTVCEVDDDCLVLELGMCDSCNGGVAVAVNTGSEADVTALHQECAPDTGEWGCTLMACTPLVARCDSGVCTL
jgi:hypothetical protein